jgi:drug/metabolite transporter (DMT)-like permease
LAGLSGVVPSSGLKWKPILIYALLITVLYQLFFLAGVSRTASGTTSLILSTIPMWTALLARIFPGEQLRPAAWGGLLTAFTGTLIVSLEGGAIRNAHGTIIGNLSILAAAVSWAAGTVYSRPLMNSISPIQLAAWSTALAMPLHLAIAVPGLLRNQQALLQPVVWGVILYSGLFSTGLALPMWNFGVRRAGAAQAAVFQNLVPVIAIAAAWLLRDEPVTVAQVIGGTLIITGILTMRLAR